MVAWGKAELRSEKSSSWPKSYVSFFRSYYRKLQRLYQAGFIGKSYPLVPGLVHSRVLQCLKDIVVKDSGPPGHACLNTSAFLVRRHLHLEVSLSGDLEDTFATLTESSVFFYSYSCCPLFLFFSTTVHKTVGAFCSGIPQQ